MGVFALLLARQQEARVTAVDNGAEGEALRALGAQRVIDHTSEDFLAAGRRYDLTLDVVGRRSIRALHRSLKPEGAYAVVGGSMRRARPPRRRSRRAPGWAPGSGAAGGW